MAGEGTQDSPVSLTTQAKGRVKMQGHLWPQTIAWARMCFLGPPSTGLSTTAVHHRPAGRLEVPSQGVGRALLSRKMRGENSPVLLSSFWYFLAILGASRRTDCSHRVFVGHCVSLLLHTSQLKRPRSAPLQFSVRPKSNTSLLG